MHFDFRVFSKFLSTCYATQGLGLRLATVLASGFGMQDEIFTSGCYVSREMTFSLSQYRAGKIVMNFDL